MIIEFDPEQARFLGVEGDLQFPEDDELIRKLAMLIEGECGGKGARKAAEKFGFSRQRYYQLREKCTKEGVASLKNQTRGPQCNYRRTEEAVRRVIRHRFLDPDASPAVIAQKLKQEGVGISMRSVERIVTDYGLQKKTPRPQPEEPSQRED